MCHEGVRDQRMKVPPGELTVHPGSYPNGKAGQLAWPKLRRQKFTKGEPANMRAATRVNPEQASKVKMRTPTHSALGEGRSATVDQPSRETGAVRRGSGSSTHGRYLKQHGRPAEARGSGPQRDIWARRRRESERFIVLMKPGNAGGGKGPCFQMLWREWRRRDWR